MIAATLLALVSGFAAVTVIADPVVVIALSALPYLLLAAHGAAARRVPPIRRRA